MSPFNVGHVQIEGLHYEQSNTDFSILCEMLKDYIALIGSVKVCY